MPGFLATTLCILVAFLPALSGFAVRTDGWYASLVRPPLSPPSWIFGPVWTLLYLLIGLSAALLWKRHPPAWLIALFLGQLLLNAAWTPLFFGLHRPLWALVDILLLDAAVAGLVLAAARISVPAAALLTPYLAWICFATWLNAGFWWWNR